jgi:hypothetical protein
MPKPSVFISSSMEGLDIARALAKQLESEATMTIWSEGAFHPGKTVLESLSEAADRSDFAVFVFTPDDVAATRGEPVTRPRQNVIFELGFLAGRLGMSRTFVVVGDAVTLDLPSDLAGLGIAPVAIRGNTDLDSAVAPVSALIRKSISDLQPRTERSVEYSSCFISYSWADKNFASKLYDNLQQVGVRCWLDAKEMKIGEQITDQIDRAIQVHDKVLLVLSRASVESAWVQVEIRNALQLEQARGTTVLFPVRIDDAVFESSVNPEVERIKQKHIGDFRNWHERDAYQRAFSRLVRDLAISASVESGERR